MIYINKNNIDYKEINHIELNDNLLYSEAYFIFNIHYSVIITIIF